MVDTAQDLIQAASSRASNYAEGRRENPTPGTMGAYYAGFRQDCDVGQDAYLMQEMTDPARHADGLRDLIRTSDPDAPGQVQARIAGYLTQYLRIELGSAEDSEAYFAARMATFEREMDSMARGFHEENDALERLYREARTAEDFAALDQMLQRMINQADENIRASLQEERELRQRRWRSPGERLAELVAQDPSVFAHPAFPPELRLLASRALLEAGLEPGSPLTGDERNELLRGDRYPLVDPVSGGIVAMTDASPRQIDVFLLPDTEPGNHRELIQNLSWAEREEERFRELDALMGPPDEPPVAPEHQIRGRILTVVRSGPGPQSTKWLARERESAEFWTSRSGDAYPLVVMARRGGGARAAIDHGLFAPRSFGGEVVLQPFGRGSGKPPVLPEHVHSLPGPERRLADLVLAVPDVYSPRFDEGLPAPAVFEGAWPAAVLRPDPRLPISHDDDPFAGVPFVAPSVERTQGNRTPGFPEGGRTWFRRPRGQGRSSG